MTAIRAAGNTGARVLVTVGSDHHPFQRLVDWADRFAQANPEVTVTVQYGTARPPAVASGHAYLAHKQLQSLMADADAIVVQGGPTGMVEARRRGRLPIVVPRRHDLGEHVDDHQVSFGRFLATTGQAIVAHDEAELHRVLADLANDRARFALDACSDAEAVSASVERFGLLVADLQPRATRFSRRRRWSRQHRPEGAPLGVAGSEPTS